MNPSLAQRVDPGPGRPGAGTGRVEEKIGKEKTRCDLARPGQKPGCNPLTFVFFLLKQRRFNFKKKRIDPGDPVIWSKPETRVLERAGHRPGFKNYDREY